MSINVFMNHSVSEKVFISGFNPNYIIYSLVETNWSRIHIFCTNLRLSPFKTIAPCSLIISWVNVYTVCHVNLLVSLHTVLSPLSGILLLNRINTSFWMLFSSKQWWFFFFWCLLQTKGRDRYINNIFYSAHTIKILNIYWNWPLITICTQCFAKIQLAFFMKWSKIDA